MKNKQELNEFISKGLGKASFYWFQTYGYPFELFKELVSDSLKTDLDKFLFISKLIKENKIKI